TTLFNRIRINYRSVLDPYYYDSVGTREFKVNRFLWDESGKLARFSSSSISLSTNLNPQAFAKKESSKVNQDDLEFINNNLGDYIDFNIPWSLTLNYNISSN